MFDNPNGVSHRNTFQIIVVCVSLNKFICLVSFKIPILLEFVISFFEK